MDLTVLHFTRSWTGGRQRCHNFEAINRTHAGASHVSTIFLFTDKCIWKCGQDLIHYLFARFAEIEGQPPISRLHERYQKTLEFPRKALGVCIGFIPAFVLAS